MYCTKIAHIVDGQNELNQHGANKEQLTRKNKNPFFFLNIRSMVQGQKGYMLFTNVYNI